MSENICLLFYIIACAGLGLGIASVIVVGSLVKKPDTGILPIELEEAKKEIIASIPDRYMSFNGNGAGKIYRKKED